MIVKSMHKNTISKSSGNMIPKGRLFYAIIPNKKVEKVTVNFLLNN